MIIIYKLYYKEMNVLRLKIALIGDSRVGKSCIVGQLVKKYFNTTYQTTLGVDYNTYEVKIKDSNIIVQFHILDLTGFSVFRDLVSTQIKEANCILYVYDSTNLESFNSLKLWKESFQDDIKSNCIEYFVGNKIDLERKVTVDETTLKNTTKALKCGYFQVSALQAKGLEEMFNKIAIQYHNNYVSFLSSVKNMSN